MAKSVEDRVEEALVEAERKSKASNLRMREAVSEVMVELGYAFQREAETLVKRATESVERAVNNAYEDAKATVMELRPPAHDAAEAITKRQRKILGVKEDKAEGDDAPLDPDLWSTS